MFKKRKASIPLLPCLAILACAWTLTTFAQAQNSEQVLYTFTGSSGGAIGGTHIVADSAGNIYGTALGGGINNSRCEGATGVPGCGVVFKLTPLANGSWQQTVLHTFTGGADGGVPAGGVILDPAGNLYGTTWYGGNTTDKFCHVTGFVPGCGVVYELSPTSSGWQFNIIHTFTGGSDGSLPFAALAMDASGNLYGTATFNGVNGFGVVFKLSNADGSWTFTPLYSFKGLTDGSAPYANVTLDSDGNIYGATYYAGDLSVSCYGYAGCGTVFKLAPTTNNQWNLTTLHEFRDGSDGAIPLFGVTPDAAGNLYGTTLYGGNESAASCVGGGTYNIPPGCGVIYKLTASSEGFWPQTILHAFGDGTDGALGSSPLAFDSSGNIYGIAGNGGDLSAGCAFGNILGCGNVFKFTPSGENVWTENVLYSFTDSTDGASPESNLLFDSNGNIYGMAEYGGDADCYGGCGVVFRITN